MNTKSCKKRKTCYFFPCNIHALITGAWQAFWHGGVTNVVSLTRLIIYFSILRPQKLRFLCSENSILQTLKTFGVFHLFKLRMKNQNSFPLNLISVNADWQQSRAKQKITSYVE